MSLTGWDSFNLGIKFRTVDLVFDVALVSFFWMTFTGRLPRAVVVIVWLYFSFLLAHVAIEAYESTNREELRTLFGMTVAYLAPVVFFVTRERAVTRRAATGLLAAACVVALLSHLGLTMPESQVSGAVDLSPFLGIQRPSSPGVPTYSDTTITVWRALSVGATFAWLVAGPSVWYRLLGVAALFLQYGGGGGGRSALLFVATVPVFLLFFEERLGTSRRLKRLLLALVLGVSFGLLYFWAPWASTEDTKESVSHKERVTEIFKAFDASSDAPGLSGRTVGYAIYWEGINASSRNYWIGTGLAAGAAFKDSPNELAHNLVLDVWGVTGLIGLTFTLVFIGSVMHDLIGLLRAAPTRGGGRVLAFAMAGSVLFMFQWLLFQAVTGDRSFMIVFYLLAGLLKPMARLLTPVPVRAQSV